MDIFNYFLKKALSYMRLLSKICLTVHKKQQLYIIPSFPLFLSTRLFLIAFNLFACLSGFYLFLSFILWMHSLIKSLSFYPTTSVNSAYLDKCQNYKPNECFMITLSKIWENISFSLSGGSWKKSATVITEIRANTF